VLLDVCQFQSPRTSFTFPACICTANGSARVSLSPVTRSARITKPARLRIVASALSLPPLPGSCSTLSEFRRVGLSVVLITSRAPCRPLTAYCILDVIEPLGLRSIRTPEVNAPPPSVPALSQ